MSAPEEASVDSPTEAFVKEKGREEIGKVLMNPGKERAAEVMAQEHQPRDPEDASSLQNCSYCWEHSGCQMNAEGKGD